MGAHHSAGAARTRDEYLLWLDADGTGQTFLLDFGKNSWGPKTDALDEGLFTRTC